MSTCVIVANAQRMRVYRADGAGRFIEREQFAHPMSRAAPAGKTHGRGASLAWGRHTRQNHYMAELLAAYLRQTQATGDASAFLIAAPSLLLLLLHTVLSDDGLMLAATVAEDLETDYKELVAHFQPQRLIPTVKPRRRCSQSPMSRRFLQPRYTEIMRQRGWRGIPPPRDRT